MLFSVTMRPWGPPATASRGLLSMKRRASSWGGSSRGGGPAGQRSPSAPSNSGHSRRRLHSLGSRNSAGQALAPFASFTVAGNWVETRKKTCLLKSANILGKEEEPSLVWLLWERFRINYQWERSLPWTELQPPRAPHPGAHTPAQEAVETSRHSETSPWPLLSWSPLPRDGQPLSAAPSGLALAQRAPTPRSSPASLPPT